ncbi:4-hydroxy-tetrahydrodipicolinate synthase [Acetobacteraceae bacterium]|nr:4-hydroxy-tetrahydrodipicolinate synthase [Acetobacteraceae bacterium]
MKRFEGYTTALVTPFLEDGTLDRQSFRRIVKAQKDAGIHGLLVAGTTGESPSLSLEERRLLMEDVRSEVKNSIPLMVGVGANTTSYTIALAKEAEKEGADALLVVTPYYNRPSQEGIYRHFMTVADATSVPLWLYDVPGRTGVRLSLETIKRLSHHANIVGIKDATGDLEQPIVLSNEILKDFSQLGGEDALSLPYFIAGGDGCISVTANVAPHLCVAMYEYWKKGNIVEAQKLQRALFSLHKAMFMESSPSPAKSALADLGLISENLRLPLVPVQSPSKEAIRKILTKLHLMEKKDDE